MYLKVIFRCQNGRSRNQISIYGSVSILLIYTFTYICYTIELYEIKIKLLKKTKKQTGLRHFCVYLTITSYCNKSKNEIAKRIIICIIITIVQNSNIKEKRKQNLISAMIKGILRNAETPMSQDNQSDKDLRFSLYKSVRVS